MRVCASLSKASDVGLIDEADMVEVRLDLSENTVPDTRGKDTLVTYRGAIDLSVLPPDFEGMIDIGEEERPETRLGIVASHHDYEATPNSERILSILNSMDADVCKIASSVRDFKDLVSILDASRSFRKKHVMLGMGPLGTVTRIRQKVLGNEFTFGYVGEPTAPGQLSVSEMKELGDDCMILGILGNPLGKSRSPAMQNAALKAAGINGIYLPFECADLEQVEEVIRGYDIRGVNITIPHKQAVIEHLDVIDDAAKSIGAVNTVVNDDGVLKGYNTDVKGIEVALERAGFDPEDKRVLIMGSGGAARACAHFMSKTECNVTITGRNRDTGRALADDFEMLYRTPESVSVMMYDLIVNCTPVGMYSDGPYPINTTHLNHHHTVFDMVYGETPLVRECLRKECRIAYGADMLAGQGAASFELWTGVKDSFDVMRRELP